MTTPPLPLDGFEDELRATLRRHAVTTPVTPRPFDADELGSYVAVPPAKPGHTRRRVAAAVLAVAACGAFAVVLRPTNREPQASAPAISAAGVDNVPNGTLQYLPTDLPEGYVISKIDRSPNPGLATDESRQHWKRAIDGAEIILNFDGSTSSVADVVDIGNGWQATVDATGFVVAMEGGSVVGGSWSSMSVTDVPAFLRTLSRRVTDQQLQGYMSSDPKWTLAEEYVGTGADYQSGEYESVSITDPSAPAETTAIYLWVADTPMLLPPLEAREVTLASGITGFYSARDQSLQWEANGHSLNLRSTVPVETLVAVASSIKAVDDATWTAAIEALNTPIVAPSPTPISTTAPPAAPTAPPDIDAATRLHYLPTDLPLGQALWHVVVRPPSSFTVDTTTLSWTRADGATVDIGIDRVRGAMNAPVVVNGWQVEVAEVDGPVGAFIATNGGTFLVDGKFQGMTAGELVAFVGTWTPRGPELIEGVDSSDPAWTLAAEHIGTGNELRPTRISQIAIGSSLNSSYDGAGIQFWIEDLPLSSTTPEAVTPPYPDGSDREFYVTEDGGYAEIVWEQDGNSLHLSGTTTADALLAIAYSVRPVSDTEWEAALDGVTERLTQGLTPYAEGDAGDVHVELYTDDIVCGMWPDGAKRCQSLRHGLGYAAVFERDGRFEAVGSWETTGDLTADAGVVVNQVQVGGRRLFHVVLPAEGGVTLNDATNDIGFSVNQEG